MDHGASAWRAVEEALQDSAEAVSHVSAAGESAVVVSVRETSPALAALAGDVRLGRLPLGIEAVELLVPGLRALAEDLGILLVYFSRRPATVIFFKAVISFPTFSAMRRLLSRSRLC
jgi:hypothetical protein